MSKCRNVHMIKLPTKPSALITLALKDLELCEKSKSYKINMGLWFRRLGKVTCSVCLAGAVMAKTLKIKKPTICQESSPGNCRDRVHINSLLSLNYFRTGYCSGAFTYLNLSEQEGVVFNRPITSYHDDSELFKEQIKELATDLKKAGY